MPALTWLHRLGDQRQAVEFDRGVEPGAPANLQQVAGQAEAGDIGHRMDAAISASRVPVTLSLVVQRIISA